jgi:hypothetical protein
VVVDVGVRGGEGRDEVEARVRRVFVEVDCSLSNCFLDSSSPSFEALEMLIFLGKILMRVLTFLLEMGTAILDQNSGSRL